jgi:hypothetical protein
MPAKVRRGKKKKHCSFSKKNRKELQTLQTFFASGNANTESPGGLRDEDGASLVSTQTQDSLAIMYAKRVGNIQ